jgi:phytoene dehydrogenase-like protein
LSALPDVPGVTRHALGSPVRIAPDLDYLERAYDHAKYGRMSTAPWIEFTIPSVFDAALAPDGAHVLSAYVQYMPYQLRPAPDDAGAGWDQRRDALGTLAIETLAAHAPGIETLVVAREVITPLDLERDWGLTGGHIFHGELTLDQAFTMRPLLGWGRYRTPIRSLYLCGSGTHPGTGLTGGSGVNAAREVIRDLK